MDSSLTKEMLAIKPLDYQGTPNQDAGILFSTWIIQAFQVFYHKRPSLGELWKTEALIELAQNIKPLTLIFQMRLQGQSICSCRVHGSKVLWTISYFSLPVYILLGCHKENSENLERQHCIIKCASACVFMCISRRHTGCFLFSTEDR